MGKSTVMLNQIIQAIYDNHGVFYYDPHGTDTDTLLQFIPSQRRCDVILLDPSDIRFPMAWNPLSNITPEEVPYYASVWTNTIKDIWDYDFATPQMEMYLKFAILTLMQAKETLFGLPYLLVSDRYRKRVLRRIKDTVLLHFWQEYFDEMNDAEQRRDISSALNKAFGFNVDPRVRNIIGQTRSQLNIGQLVEDGRILLARLPQGQLGMDVSKFFGSMLVSQLHQALLKRQSSVPFHLYLDEVHHISKRPLKEMLSGIRKFNAQLVLAHQYVDQLSPDLFASIRANTGEQMVFRVSSDDAVKFQEPINWSRPANLDCLPKYVYRSFPFNTKRKDSNDFSVSPLQHDSFPDGPAAIRANTRRNYCRNAEAVEKRINNFMSDWV